MAESKKSSSKKIIDVSHPGKTPPSSSGKPVIVTNRPILQDPMVVTDAPQEEQPGAPPVTAPTTARIKITPLTDDSSEKDTPAEKPSKEKTIAQLAEEAEKRSAEKAAPTPEPPAPEAQPEKAEPSKEEPASLDAPLPDKKKPAKTDEDEAEAKKKREAELEKLVENKKYYLSINSVEKRRTKRAITIGVVLCLLLGAVWLDVALDAGILKLQGVKPLTHFFSN